MGVLRTDLGLAKSDRRFPLKGTCMDIYSRCVNARETVEEAVETHFPWCKDEVEDLRKLFAAYVDRKGEQSVLDYDDLLLFWHGLLTDRRAARSIRGRFDCVLVDEYQDTNVLQAEILQMLCPGGKNLTVVGRRRPGHLLLPGRHRPEHPRLPPAVPRHHHRHPRAELPQHAAHPRRHQRGHRRSRRAARQEPVVAAARRRQAPIGLLRGRGRADRVRHPAHPRAPGGGRAAPPPGGALPGFASQPGARAGARPPQHPLPQVRGPALRRDRARQGPAGLPAARREPAGPDGRHPGADAPARSRAQEGPRPHGQPGGRTPGRAGAADGRPAVAAHGLDPGSAAARAPPPVSPPGRAGRLPRPRRPRPGTAWSRS